VDNGLGSVGQYCSNVQMGGTVRARHAFASSAEGCTVVCPGGYIGRRFNIM
jgi:hypothetical protein